MQERFVYCYMWMKSDDKCQTTYDHYLSSCSHWTKTTVAMRQYTNNIWAWLTVTMAVNDTFVKMHSCILCNFITFNKRTQILYTTLYSNSMFEIPQPQRYVSINREDFSTNDENDSHPNNSHLAPNLCSGHLISSHPPLNKKMANLYTANFSADDREHQYILRRYPHVI